MTSKLSIYLLLLTFCLTTGCDKQKTVNIQGTIDYVGSAEVFISKQPVHYKYAPKIRFPVSLKDEKFSLSVPVDSTQIIEFNVGDQSYPLIAAPGETLILEIERAKFPLTVDVEGYPHPYDSLLTAYYTREQVLVEKIGSQISRLRRGDTANVISLYKKRYELARQYFQGTPLEPVYHQTVGEYLVKRLEKVEYNRNQPGFEAGKVRQNIIDEAKRLNFFTFESLYAQRAGIRDFTNAFANTFGVADSIEQLYGQDLMKYDIKRLGYETLDSARTSVLKYIEGRRAKAYAKMHLIAGRLGAMPLEVATPSYRQFLNEHKEFPRYTSFLKSFYRQMKQVSPGQPAVAFALPNKKGEMVQMKDFRGKYVLLDFWASWCIPCLDEFDDMKEIYANYPRDVFEIVAISIEEDSLRWRHALQRFENPWPQLYGGNGFQQETFRAYRGGGIPFYILVGPGGNILRYNDIRPSFNLPAVLDSLIGQKQ